jgi:hypothetical protein
MGEAFVNVSDARCGGLVNKDAIAVHRVATLDRAAGEDRLHPEGKQPAHAPAAVRVTAAPRILHRADDNERIAFGPSNRGSGSKELCDGIPLQYDVVVKPQVMVILACKGPCKGHTHATTPVKVAVPFNENAAWKQSADGACSIVA